MIPQNFFALRALDGHPVLTWMDGYSETTAHLSNSGKKRSEKTQTLRAGCSKAEPKIFAPPLTPSLGRGTAKNQSAADGHYTFTYKPPLAFLMTKLARAK